MIMFNAKRRLARRLGKLGFKVNIDGIKSDQVYDMSDSSTDRSPTRHRISKITSARKYIGPKESEIRRREEEDLKREKKLKALEDAKNSYSYKLSVICRSKNPRSVPMDESKADKLIGYRHYIHRKVALEWRAGRTFMDISGRIEYKSVWMILINRLLFNPDLSDQEGSMAMYHETLGIDQRGDKADIRGDEIKDGDLVAVALWLSICHEDLAVDRCLMPAVDSDCDWREYYGECFE